MGLRDELNVFRGAHHLAPVLARSTGIMCHAVITWLRGGADGQFGGRLIALCLPGYLAIHQTAQRPWLWWVWGGSWLTACLIIAARRGDTLTDIVEPAEDAAPTEAAGEQPTEDEQPTQADHLRQHVEHQVAAAVQAGTKGVRVAQLLTDLQAGGHLRSWDATQLKETLRGIGVPVRDQMYFKVDGRKTNQPGVHVDDLTKTLGRRPHLPPHLVPDLTPSAGSPAALLLVKDDGGEDAA